MAAVLVLGPILEADMPSEQYAYREGRSALDAVEAVNEWLYRGYTEVVDGDPSGDFDSIPHAELMKSVARRVSIFAKSPSCWEFKRLSICPRPDC